MRKSPHELGIAMRIWKTAAFFYKHKCILLSKLFYSLNYILFGCIIPASTKIGPGSCFPHSTGIVIHHNAIIGENCRIMHNVTIGNDGVIIGNNCFLGTGCVIQGPCVIGDNVRIGANTYVDFDIPNESTVVGGSKGRILKRS